jgi:RNA polymerase sigma-70 factor (ECF subfamily)
MRSLNDGLVFRQEAVSMGPDSRLFFEASATSSGLIDSVRAGDSAAWQRLVSYYSPLVYAWCRRSDLVSSDAADVMQEVFVAVWRGLAGFRREEPGETFRGWLRVIARNKISDHFRRQAALPQMVGGGSALEEKFDLLEADSTSVHERGPLQSLFQQAFAAVRTEFEPDTWQAFLLTTVEGRSSAEVAGELEMSPGGVRQAKYKVLRRLRQELGDARP